MDARPVATVGGFPIMEEFETGTSDHFKMIFEAAIRLRNGGMSDHQAIKTAINIHDNLLDVLNGDDDAVSK